MKNILKNSFLFSAVVVVLLLTGCDKWTQTEGLEIENPTLGSQNPELNARYLAALKEYKNSDHKAVFVWFNNSVKETFSRAQHLTDVPDSVDVISLTFPDNLTSAEVAEMAKIREKGTQTVYTISFRAIDDLYKELLDSNPEADPKPEFMPFMESYMDNALSLCGKYGYDGVSIWYNGQSTGNMTAAQLQVYTDIQTALFAKVLAWKTANSGKMLIYEGYPQYLLDKTILASCKYIVLRTQSETSAFALNFAIQEASVAGVPADRFIVSVQTQSMDATDKTTGLFANGDRAVAGGAYCVIDPSNGKYVKAGLAIMNVQNDYYNTSQSYKYTRAAITIMNPANN